MHGHTNLFTYGLCPQENNNNIYNQQSTILAALAWVIMLCNNRDDLVACQHHRCKWLVSLIIRKLLNNQNFSATPCCGFCIKMYLFLSTKFVCKQCTNCSALLTEKLINHSKSALNLPFLVTCKWPPVKFF